MSAGHPTRRGVVLGLAGLGAAALAGCGLPATGPIQRGLGVGAPALPPVRVQFDAPPPGADRETIVRGFLAAGWSAQEDYRAARAYLTPEASAAWDPRAAVTVHGSAADLRLEHIGRNRIRLGTEEIAHVDSLGRYVSRPRHTPATTTLGLDRVGTEWRISRLDPGFGLWLAAPYFETAFRGFEVAYVAATGGDIVTDARWFPVGPGLATILARAQLDPVPDYLAGAARTGFPRGVVLGVDSVPVVDGRAEIELGRVALDVGPQERRAAWAQALTTLRQVPEVTSVSLQVDGRGLDVVGMSEAPTSTESLGYRRPAPRPLVIGRRRGSTLGVVEAHEVDNTSARTRFRGLPDVPEGWIDVAVSPDGSDVAAVGGDRLDVRRWRAGDSRQAPRFARDLRPPAYDAHGVLWLAGLDPRSIGGVWVVDAAAGLGASPRRLSAPWIGGRPLLEARPSPAGHRVAVLRRGPGGGTRIGVSGVVRDEAQRPTALAEPLGVGGDVAEATRLAWIDEMTLVVLGRRAGDGAVRPLVVSVGGPTEALSPVADPTYVASVGGRRGLVVASGSGVAYGISGSGWREVGRFDEVFVPGG